MELRTELLELGMAWNILGHVDATWTRGSCHWEDLWMVREGE